MLRLFPNIETTSSSTDITLLLLHEIALITVRQRYLWNNTDLIKESFHG